MRPRRILAVCVSNVGRSQIAQALLERCLPGAEVTSAGLDVGDMHGERGQKGARDGFPLLRPDIVRVAASRGIDLRRMKRSRVVQALVDWADDVILVTTSDEERKYIPEWFSAYESKVSRWPVFDWANREKGDAQPSDEEISRMVDEVQRFAREWCAGQKEFVAD